MTFLQWSQLIISKINIAFCSRVRNHTTGYTNHYTIFRDIIYNHAIRSNCDAIPHGNTSQNFYTMANEDIIANYWAARFRAAINLPNGHTWRKVAVSANHRITVDDDSAKMPNVQTTANPHRGGQNNSIAKPVLDQKALAQII